ncbi:exodeoxyribonuclease V subunit gamma [Corallincola platygyrae]|uniref:RecBCD enzyme subunit RecC n=1 Tax=Corallincola platygyrae TaxID=1193278 RepID=A0ABW4XQT6_9GAMM
MLTVYPSNRLEDLSFLIEAVLATRQGSVLQPDTILVESQGMQHWLNMQLAESQGIAMNLQFPMPSRFIWDTARLLLGQDAIPKQSPYRREVLAWRIDSLLESDGFKALADASAATHYWGGDGSQPDPLKRFQLATKLADLFEQYMMFRAEWILAWEGQQTATDSDELENWQAWLWRELVREEPYHPVKLQKMALEAMAENASKLPKQVMIFAINTLAPQTLAFFEALAAYSDIHLFHLNPCVSFWGDVQSDKAKAKWLREAQVDAWTAGATSGVNGTVSGINGEGNHQEAEPSNPLLANLGQQGREFFNLLQSVQGYEISAFADSPENQEQQRSRVLQQLQSDILNLRDARENPPESAVVDDSIVVSSAHSALREIQSLHDYLLHQFANDPALKPQDVLVMCPAIEDYAPYIDAVFRRPWDKQNPDTPRLPCSIADRTLLDSEPLISTFSELLLLPDSRFEISRILDYIRLPALQKKFGFTDDELSTIEWWLRDAAIHWGLDSAHKQAISGNEQSSDKFTWQWGLSRLLLGFAQSDQEQISHGRLLLPHVEGQQAILLGRLMQLLERLQSHAATLLKARTPEQWQNYLLQLRDGFFAPEQGHEQEAFELIGQAISSLGEYTAQAGYEQTLGLEVVRHYLNHHFTQPDGGNHFLTGQITFCSMVPMRSIPFKVIAVLGLNDGQYPRQSVPLSFDLMAATGRKPGDRSRRGDDRYLFLEALISARHSLYLSYQGNNIRNNAERQPSLILKELMDYLTHGYGWQLDPEAETVNGTETRAEIRAEISGNQNQLLLRPLHPFSEHNYTGRFPSFDPGWIRLNQPQASVDNLISLPAEEPTEKRVQLEQLVRFFDDPLRGFAQERLGLRLGQQVEALSDPEPFAPDGLTGYQIKDALSEAFLSEHSVEAANLIRERYELSGLLPESPLTPQFFDECEQISSLYAEAYRGVGQAESEPVTIDVGDWTLEANLNWNTADEQRGLLMGRPATRKAKDDLSFWLHHLVATLVKGEPVQSHFVHLHSTDQGKTFKARRAQFEATLTPKIAGEYLLQWISTWQQALTQPQLLHGALGKTTSQALLKLAAKAGIPLDNETAVDFYGPLAGSFETAWQQALAPSEHGFGIADNPYFQWFYRHTPEFSEPQRQLLCSLYLPIYSELQEIKK